MKRLVYSLVLTEDDAVSIDRGTMLQRIKEVTVMGLINQILCIIEGIVDSIFGILNSSLGGFLGVELTPPGLGCEVAEES